MAHAQKGLRIPVKSETASCGGVVVWAEPYDGCRLMKGEVPSSMW